MHVIALDSAAPCFVDFLPVPHINLAELRLHSDAVPSTACITACLYEDACRDAVRMIPPSWSLIKWLCQKPAWNRFY